MRIPSNDPMWKGVPEFWTSRVLSPSFLDAARGDRSLWVDLGRRISGFDSTAMMGARAWGEASRISMLYRGTGAVGLPASTLDTIVQGLGPLVLNPPNEVGALVEQLGRTAIGIAVDVLAAIPIVGSIAKAIGSMALFIWDITRMDQSTAREFLPPPQEYDRNAEEYVMNTQLVPALTTSDWTRLFMPRIGTVPKLVELDTGWLLTSDAAGAGLGFIPGTQQITSSIQALWHQKSQRARGSSAIHQDIGDFFPGPAQLMTAIDQQVQQPGPELWSVVPSEIRSAWREYRDSVMEFAFDLYFGRGLGGTGLEKLNEEHRRLVVQQLVAPLHVSPVEDDLLRGALAANFWTPKNPPDDIVEAFVEPWCDRVEQLQEYYLGTVAVAYANPSSAAFERDPKLDDQRKAMQALLLSSPARFEVDQRDVIDAEYQRALMQATVGAAIGEPGDGSTGRLRPPRLGAGGRGPNGPKKPQGGVPLRKISQPDAGGGGIALGLGLAALAVAWRKLRS